MLLSMMYGGNSQGLSDAHANNNNMNITNEMVL